MQARFLPLTIIRNAQLIDREDFDICRPCAMSLGQSSKCGIEFFTIADGKPCRLCNRKLLYMPDEEFDINIWHVWLSFLVLIALAPIYILIASYFLDAGTPVAAAYLFILSCMFFFYYPVKLGNGYVIYVRYMWRFELRPREKNYVILNRDSFVVPRGY